LSPKNIFFKKIFKIDFSMFTTINKCIFFNYLKKY
jgi:hypothetical protein